MDSRHGGCESGHLHTTALPRTYRRDPRLDQPPQIITVTFNTAIDRVIEVPGMAIGGHLPGRQRQRYPAGKGINVSRALARLGTASVAMGFIGHREQDWFERTLTETGPAEVTPTLLPVDGVTRENLTLIDPDSGRDMHIRTPGYAVDGQTVHELASKLHAALHDAARPRKSQSGYGAAVEPAIVAFCGSLPPGMTARHLAELLATVEDAGARVALDLDGRVLATLIPGERADRSADAAIPPSAATLWLAKPNRQELADWVAEATAAETADVRSTTGEQLFSSKNLIHAAESLFRHLGMLAISLGRDGAWLLTERERWSGRIALDPGREKVVNTVGCGDSMVAGLIDARARGLDAAPTLAHALGCATANALAAGVAEFDRVQVEDLAQRAEIEQGLRLPSQ